MSKNISRVTQKYGGTIHAVKRFGPGMTAETACGILIPQWRGPDGEGKICKRCSPLAGDEPYILNFELRLEQKNKVIKKLLVKYANKGIVQQEILKELAIALGI